MSGADLERLVREPEPYAAPARLQARIALHGFGPADAEDFHRWLWRVAVRPPSFDSTTGTSSSQNIVK